MPSAAAKTRPVVERAKGHLEFDRIADVRLKGFTDSTEVFIARERNGSMRERNGRMRERHGR